MTTEETRERIVGVKRLSEYLKRLVESDKRLRGIGVAGEISNLKPHPLGLFFNLKEEEAVLSCVAWSDVAGTLGELRDGLAITAFGSFAVWPKRSGYQFIVRNVRVGGLGDLHVRYEELRKRLAAEGLFDRPKRPLPRYPFHIALISSSRAAGFKDFLEIVGARAPHVRVTLLETPVQGPTAAPGIVDALARASRMEVDVVALVRGGGSAEDIFAFSEESVVRAICASTHPVVTGVGHAQDVPLCDLVADRRAETPSNAAHILTERSTAQLREMIADRARRCAGGARRALLVARRAIAAQVDRSALQVPERVLEPHRRRVWEARERLEGVDPVRRFREHRAALTLLTYRFTALAPVLLERKRTRLALTERGLSAADPLAILARGYAVVKHDGKIVREAREVAPGQAVGIVLHRGKLLARVEEQLYG